MEYFNVLDWKKWEIFTLAAVVLATVLISTVQLRTGQMKTRDAQRKADVELVARALKSYYADYGYYPLEATGSGQILLCGKNGEEICAWGESEIRDIDNVVYLKKVPQDPYESRGWKYMYVVSPSRKSFRIYVGLEYKRDEAYKNNLTQECGEGVQCNWYVE